MLPRCILKSRPAKTVKNYQKSGSMVTKIAVKFQYGITIVNTIAPHPHNAVKKANQRIGIFKRCFTDLTESKVKTLYQVVERPTLEYAIPAWNPYTPPPSPHPHPHPHPIPLSTPPPPPPPPHPTTKYIDSLEKVQNNFSKLTNFHYHSLA